MKAQTLTVIMGAVLLVLGRGFISSSQSAAQEQMEFPSTSGNAFTRVCSIIDNQNDDAKTSLDLQHSVACLAYVSGIVSGVSAEVEFSQAVTNVKPPSPFCLPKGGVETGQLVRIVLKYIRNHPEEAHYSGSQMVLEGLMEAFPCGKKTQ